MKIVYVVTGVNEHTHEEYVFGVFKNLNAAIRYAWSMDALPVSSGYDLYMSEVLSDDPKDYFEQLIYVNNTTRQAYVVQVRTTEYYG